MDSNSLLGKLKSLVGVQDAEASISEEDIQPAEQAIEDLRFKKLSEKMKAPSDKSDYFSPEGTHPEDKFLDNIASIESSGGKNLNHPEIKYGLQKGSSAFGRYGLMPNTVRDLSSMLSNKKSMLKMKLGESHYDPEVESLRNLKDNEIKQKLSEKPELERRLARYLATRVGLMEGDELDKAYRWNQGHNLKKSDIDQSRRDASDYIQKYKKALEAKKVKA